MSWEVGDLVEIVSVRPDWDGRLGVIIDPSVLPGTEPARGRLLVSLCEAPPDAYHLDSKIFWLDADKLKKPSQWEKEE